MEVFERFQAVYNDTDSDIFWRSHHLSFGYIIWCFVTVIKSITTKAAGHPVVFYFENVKRCLHFKSLWYKIGKELFTFSGGEAVMPVRNNIRKIRKERGIKQIQMAEDLQVTRQTMTAIENNKYNPSLELALKIVKYFDLPIEEIFILEEDDDEK